MEDFLFIRDGRSYLKIKLSEILFIESEKKYVNIVTATKTYLTLASITHIEKLLSGNFFCRIHRCYVISLEHTTKFDNEFVYIGTRRIPIAEQYKNALKESVTIVNTQSALSEKIAGNSGNNFDQKLNS
jgi:DNA-binding LytR/AlgR family response regulator